MDFIESSGPSAALRGQGPWQDDERPHWLQSAPFLLAHVVALAAPFFVPFTWWAVPLAVAMYYLRMAAVTAGYHRYFAHRSYRTSRAFQFLLALLGATAAQKGVLWWAAHHRDHHKFSDTDEDVHSPSRRGFWWSHVGWILAKRYEQTRYDRIRDFARFPELVWLNRYHILPVVAFAALLFALGGPTALVWGFFVSTVLLWHGTFTINSLSHVFGRRRYPTTDTSRNNWVLALITMGEGWHNNHHYYQGSANQGFFWWEVDASFYLLKALEKLGLVWDLRRPPASVLAAGRADGAAPLPALATPAQAAPPA